MSAKDIISGGSNSLKLRMTVSNLVCDTKSNQNLLYPPTPSETPSPAKDTSKLTMDGSMRRRKYVKCPLCEKNIVSAKLDDHYHEELALFRDVKGLSDTISSIIVPAKRNRSSHQSEKEKNMYNKYHTKAREVLEKVKKSKQKRKSGKKKRNNPEASTENVDEYTCCVCQQVIIGSLNDINSHIDQCLNSVNMDDNDDEEEFEVYECGGTTRVKVFSGVDAPLESLGFTTSKSEDVADELDVDGDDSDVYGPPQFTECLTETKDDESAEVSVDVGEDDLPLMPAQNNNYLINALKARIIQLEKQERPQCLICMDDYRKPLTSVICWHVHCEPCWMSTLGQKKVCPQCNVITTPKDLRRIYL